MCDNEHHGQAGDLSLDDVYNRVVVRYTPRSTLVSGVIADATSVIEVPPKASLVRWNKVHDSLGGGDYTPSGDLRPGDRGECVVSTPYIDPATGSIA